MIAPVTAKTSALACGALIALGVGLTRLFLREVARTRAFERGVVGLSALAFATHAVWLASPWWSPKYAALRLSMVLLVTLPLCVASIPAASLLRRVTRAVLRVRDGRAPAAQEAAATPPSDTGDAVTASAISANQADNANLAPARTSREPTPSRRAILGAATALAPTLAFGTGLSGFFAGQCAPRDKRVVFTYANLPRDLDGLCILHLSDLHLGADRTVDDLEEALERLRDHAPDLIVFTGDVAEDVDLLGPALAAAVRHNPRLGVYASLGNHEYLNDVDRALAVYRAQSDVRLLVSEGEPLRVGSSRLFLGGADDPRFMRADPMPFLRHTAGRALARAPGDAFRVLLSHRPEGLDAVPAGNVDLVLSGHTHGGQIGFNGKSAFERIWPERYLWGPYARGDARLYTTSGFGHWFPFRVGCDAEAPIIELRRG